jgi:hypothetical protein
MKYGQFSDWQLYKFIKRIRKTIFLLLLAVDNKTKDEYEYIDINKTFEGVLLEIGGAASIMSDRYEFVETMSFLERAKLEYLNPQFDYKTYRKLILDAGAKMLSLEKALER